MNVDIYQKLYFFKLLCRWDQPEEEVKEPSVSPTTTLDAIPEDETDFKPAQPSTGAPPPPPPPPPPPSFTKTKRSTTPISAEANEKVKHNFQFVFRL